MKRNETFWIEYDCVVVYKGSEKKKTTVYSVSVLGFLYESVI